MASSATGKTYFAKPGEVQKRWYVVDADGRILGRLAAEAARRLQGKHKPRYTPHVDCGDFIVVVNAEKVKVSGGKETKKAFRWYTGWLGGLREETVAQTRAKHPERLIERAVKRMLPKSRLGRRMFKKLKVYAGPDHPHQAQSPERLEID